MSFPQPQPLGIAIAVALASAAQLALVGSNQISAGEPAVNVTGRVVDATTGEILPARVYVRSADGRWFFPHPASQEGTAVEYRRERSPKCVEMHTTLSAHPFELELPPGTYTVTAERGKEYATSETQLTVDK